MSGLSRSFTTEYVVDPNDIRSMIEALREGK
jgi:hypothetical protein